MKKKLEIINVDLGINIAEEIKQKVDSLDTKLIEHTKKAIKKTVKVQKVSKRAKEKEQRQSKVKKAVRFLEKAFEEPDLWLEGKHLLKVAELENTSQNVNKVAMQIRRHLELEDKWTLTKKRKSGKTVYRLARFEQ